MTIKDGERHAVFCTENASVEELEKMEVLGRELGIKGTAVTGTKRGERRTDRVHVKTVSEL